MLLRYRDQSFHNLSQESVSLFTQNNYKLLFSALRKIFKEAPQLIVIDGCERLDADDHTRKFVCDWLENQAYYQGTFARLVVLDSCLARPFSKLTERVKILAEQTSAKIRLREFKLQQPTKNVFFEMARRNRINKK